MKVLVVGGTGPTGPHVVRGLLERGDEVAIFHRGTHEPPGLPDVEHIHGDPHFRASIENAVGARDFDVVVAMYGRLKHLAPALAGRCGQFVAIGGVPVYQGFFPSPSQSQLPVPVTEDHPAVQDATGGAALAFSRRLADAEAAVFAHHPRATVLRFPMLFGPNNARPAEWSVVKRVRDGRPFMILPDGGGQIHTRCAAANAAAFVLAVLDAPEVAAGQVYNAGEATSWSLRDWATTIARLMGADLELVGLPREIAVEATTTLLPLAGTTATHVVVSTEKARRELDYTPAVDPLDALAELVAWYAESPAFDPAASPSFTDRFDYPTEDALLGEYRAAVERLAAAVDQRAAPPIHSMPHPQRPGEVDHRGR
ncbi:epimerase [Frankia sp. CNm7]|uniref:Epimerase n=1 Tax=Frankia nepalensis TaxID=1836974 RepID=A0A937RMD6_9ACTN|nr:epimerase [Frankia nepalensis]MBL7494963.1 epimerase [Frankia nepalensis]MBL7514586.1 epimerase [Frankia nepalensis]MBL7523822.1 epimerase [Frankia nepalensis]MBL7633087.1 epimerase [Frankia nepalensis]